MRRRVFPLLRRAAHASSAPCRSQPFSVATRHFFPTAQKRHTSRMPSGQTKHAEMWAPVIEDCINMPCTLDYQAVEKLGLADKKTIAVVGTKDSLEAFGKAEVLPEHLRKAFDHLVSKLKPKPLRGDSHTHLVIDDSVTEELIVGCVSDVASRHTSKHRGDQVRQFVKSVAPKAEKALVLASPDMDGFFSYATSAPKGHSLCVLKGESDGFAATGRESMPTGVWVAEGDQPTAKQLADAQIVAESIQLTGRLVDMPTNYLNTKTYAQIAEGLAKRFGFDIDVIRDEQLQEQGMNVLYAVGRAAEYTSALAVMSHTPAKPASDEVVCWCGKGIVYDTGGLSIKSTAGMSGMKRDMGGSAGVLGGFVASVRLGVPVKLHALLALADNAVNDKSLRNDDVVRCLSGKTVEINNTDAEGRLVLCDTVAYAHKAFNPTTLLDMATLTGAQGVATGKHFASICANDDSVEAEALAAGKASGDQCFPVIFAPEFLLPEFDSKVADAVNSVGCRTNAQVSCAGLFIYDIGFAGKYEGRWIHIDMAYPVEVEGRGTGWGVGLLVKMIGAM